MLRVHVWHLTLLRSWNEVRAHANAHTCTLPLQFTRAFRCITPVQPRLPSPSQVVVIVRASAKSILLPLAIMRIASSLQCPAALLSALAIVLVFVSLCDNVKLFESMRPSARPRPPRPRGAGQAGRGGGGGGDDCGRPAAAAEPAITASAAMTAGSAHSVRCRVAFARTRMRSLNGGRLHLPPDASFHSRIGHSCACVY